MRAFGLPAGSILVLALTTGAAPAFAQTPTPQQAPSPAASTVEVTPFISIGSLASSRVGNAVSFPITSNLNLEAEFGYRRGEGNINALSAALNVLYDLPPIGRVTPYVAAGAGLEEYGSAFTLPGRPDILTQRKLAFTINAGGGLKVPVDDKWSLRTDARWFAPVGTNGSEHWRLYQGAAFGVGKKRAAASAADR